MGSKGQKKQNIENEGGEYELEAPDGGWGYVIVAATVVSFSVTIIPTSAFGLVYGNFLKSVGDETTGTTLCSAMFNTVSSFTGLLANGLLARYTYRIVGFIGAISFVLGAGGLIFAQNLIQLIGLYGVMEGMGYGLVMPACLAAFNGFFDKKMAVMMSVAQALMIAFNMAVPQLAAWSMTEFGFRGTLVGLAILASLSVPAVATLQPVTKYMRKVYGQTTNSTVIPVEDSSNNSVPPKILKAQVEPLIMAASHRSLHSYHPRPRRSIVSVGFTSVMAVNEVHNYERESKTDEDSSFWQSFLKSMDMSLLKDLKYLNISIGLALCYTGDMAFISIIPLMLGNIGFKPQEIALMMAVFFGSDLVSRILLTIISSLVKFKSRIVVLVVSIFIVLARIALLSYDTYMWKLVCLGILGFLRCFIQTPLPLVISEEYQDRFATAYSLWMAVNGVVSLICGPLMSFIKSYTESDVIVCHVLTVTYIICIVSWISEFLCCRKKTSKTQEPKS